MNHPSDEDLVLHLYRETEEPDRVDAHLESCARCREEVALLRQVLAEVDEVAPPEPPEDYGARVWEKVSRALPRPRTARSLPRIAYWLAAAAVILAATFLAGRFTARRPERADERGRLRERILLVALADHLEESKVLLLEVENRGDAGLAVDRERAGELLQASRLYRQTAYRLGDVTTADVLDELERILLDVSQGPDSIEARQALRSRIRERDLLFKLRILDAKVKKL